MKKITYYLFGIIILFCMILLVRKGTFSEETVVSFSGTREELQNTVVSAALSYYYNQNYSDYEQYPMDFYYNDNGLLSLNNYCWRNFRNSPEMVSRSNMFNVDCSTFTTIAYLYTLGFDFSEFDKTNWTGKFANEKKVNYYNANNKKIETLNTYNGKTNDPNTNIIDSALAWQKGYLINGHKGHGILADSNDNNELVYCIKFNENENQSEDDEIDTEDEVNEEDDETSDNCISVDRPTTKSGANNILANVFNTLQPGDILFYSRVSGTGHRMLYVGNVTGNTNERGFIHSTGTDTFTKQDSATNTPAIIKDESKNYGEDAFSIKFDPVECSKAENELLTADDFAQCTGAMVNNSRLNAYQILGGSNSDYAKIGIYRPINKYCTTNNNKETCTINKTTLTSPMHKSDDNLSLMLNNDEARNELSNMKVEQYQTRGNFSKNILNKYNSVNIGDTITYHLLLDNRNTFKYCTNGLYNNENDCKNTQLKYEWRDNECWYQKNDLIFYKATASYVNSKDTCEQYNEQYSRGYCEGANYSNVHGCINNKGKWVEYEWKTKPNSKINYNNFVISAKIPEGTEYVSNSCNFVIHSITDDAWNGIPENYQDKCTKDTTNKVIKCSICSVNGDTITWDNVSILSSQNATRTFNYDVKPSKNGIVTNEGMNITLESGHKLQMGEMNVSVNDTLRKSSDIKRIQDILDNRTINNVQYGSNSGIKFIRDIYYKYLYGTNTIDTDDYLYNNSLGSWSLNNNLKNYLTEFTSYLDMRDAVFIDTNSSNTKAYWQKRLDYSNASNKQITINNMLVPGEYGGRFVRGNLKNLDDVVLYKDDASNRAGILFKNNGQKMSLEIGDVILGLSIKDDDKTYREMGGQTVFILYDYDSNNLPIFYSARYANEKTIFRKYDANGMHTMQENGTWSNEQNSNTGYAIYKQIYNYGWFMVFRPTRVYGNSKIYKIILNNQGASTTGTTNLWYKYNTNKDLNGQTCYYYTDENSTQCLDNYTITPPQKTGYTFSGYYTKTNGEGTSYIGTNSKFFNQLWKKLPSDIEISNTDTITLYANWNINKYTVSVKVNNGTGNKSEIVEYNNTTTFMVKPNDGYKKSTVSCTNNQTATLEDNVLTTGKITNDTECTITFEKDKYIVTADTNGGTITNLNDWTINDSVATKEVYYDEEYGLLPEVSKDGYIFKGWYSSQIGGTKINDNTKVENTTNHNIYAVWEAIGLDFNTTEDLKVNKDNLIISNIMQGTSLIQFDNKIIRQAELDVNITDKEGNPITNRQYLVTGDILKISNKIDEINYFIMVKGDVNATGIMDEIDAKILAKYIIDGTSDYNRNYLYAGDMNEDEKIKINDVISLLKSISN